MASANRREPAVSLGKKRTFGAAQGRAAATQEEQIWRGNADLDWEQTQRSGFIQPDTRVLGNAISRRASRAPLYGETIVYLICLHEFEHALDLAHSGTDAHTMYDFGFGGDIED